MTDVKRVNSDDVVVNFPDTGCPLDARLDKHVHTQAEWRRAAVEVSP